MNNISIVRGTNSVTNFCWNELNGQNYKEVARRIHGTDCWNYKYKEVIFNNDSRCWPILLLRYLPEIEAAKLVEYCAKFYNPEL